MVSVTRAGRARPASGGLELAVWYLIRLTGLGLFVLALGHFLITHVVYDPVEQTGAWIVEERWGSLLWRTVDWLMLSMVLFHSFMGVRTVLGDYTSGALRAGLTMILYLAGITLFALGTMAVATMSAPVP
jgi:succinate dehydrogenase / fumarate reductase membrane anchor subunit